MTFYAVYFTGLIVTFVFTMADYLAEFKGQEKREEVVALIVGSMCWPIILVHATGEMFSGRGRDAN